MVQSSKSNIQSRDREQLEQRRQTAWAIAHQCEKVLREQFGATQVILFGSLVGQSPWHWGSDLDIAVSGLSNHTWLKAYGCLESLAPDWLKIDLVRLETVSPPVRTRIFQDTAMPSSQYLALKEHLDDELLALEQSAGASRQALERASGVGHCCLIWMNIASSAMWCITSMEMN